MMHSKVKLFLGVSLVMTVCGLANSLEANARLPVVTFASAGVALSESVKAHRIILNLSEVASTPVFVPLTASGTAQSGSDYTFPMQSATIAAGQLSTSVWIRIINDTAIEENEFVTVSIGAGVVGATVGTISSYEVQILDDDKVTSGCSSASAIAQVRMDHPGNAVNASTVPVPDGLVSKTMTASLAFVDSDDQTVVPTDMNVVTYSPNGEFARVVELVAWLKPKPAPGPSVYKVVGDCPLTPQGLVNGGPSIDTILSGTGIFGLTAKDFYGNVYFASLNNPASVRHDTRRNGSVIHSFQVSTAFRPVLMQSNSLSYLLRVEAFVEITEDGLATIALQLHNASSGLGPSQKHKPIGWSFFTGVDLLIENTSVDAYADIARVQMNILDSATGKLASTPKNWSGVPVQSMTLIKPSSNGKMHGMVSGESGTYSIAIASNSMPSSRVRAMLDWRGWGVVTSGKNLLTNKNFYSWQNPLTSYFPFVGYPIPELTAAETPGVRSELTGLYNQHKNALASGSVSMPWFEYPAVGWKHYYMAKYGAFTGGTLINASGDYRVASAGLPEGLLYSRMVMQAFNDHDYNRLVDENGLAELRFNSSNHGPKDYFQDIYANCKRLYALPGKTLSDNYGKKDSFFGLCSALEFSATQGQHAAVLGANAIADDVANLYYDLGTWTNVDHQHRGRPLQDIAIQIALANSPVAKWLAMQHATIVVYGVASHPREGGDLNYTLIGELLGSQINPNRGVPDGRGTAWGIQAVALAFAIQSDGFRKGVHKEFLDIATDYFLSAQLNCPQVGTTPEFGALMSANMSKGVHSEHYIHQTYESALMQSATDAMRFHAYQGTADPRESTLELVLRRHAAYLVLSDLMWNKATHLPFEWVGTASKNQAPYQHYCSPTDSIFAQYAPSQLGTESFQHYFTYASGYRNSGDIRYVCRSIEAAGVSSLKLKLENAFSSVSNPGNTGVLRQLWQSEFQWVKPAACP